MPRLFTPTFLNQAVMYRMFSSNAVFVEGLRKMSKDEIKERFEKAGLVSEKVSIVSDVLG
jgi:hypothetical protein